MLAGSVCLEVGNVSARVLGYLPKDVAKEIDRATSYSLPGSWFAGRYGWDGRCHLFRDNVFPSGLMHLVVDVLSNRQIDYKIDDTRVLPDGFGSYEINGVKLRPYQKAAIAAMLRERRGVVHAPTGSGKTAIAAAVIKALDVPTAYVVHTSTLFSQVKADFDSMLDEPVGVLGSGRNAPRKVTICMVQTLMSMLHKHQIKFFDGIKAIFYDEAHHVSSDGSKASWYISSTHFCNAAIRFGLSATPVFRKSGMLLYAATGPIIYQVTVPDLQKRGWISDSRPIFIRITDPPLYSARTYSEAYSSGVVDNALRNTLAVRVALAHAEQGRLVMLFVDRIEHGRIVEDEIKASGTRASYRFLCGLDEHADIEFVKQQAKQRDVKILIVTRKLFGEGIDIPAVDVLINLAAGKSAVAFIQMFGRGLRVSKGKKGLLFVDFLDDNNRYLADHSKQRMMHCRRLKQKVQIMGADDVTRNPALVAPDPGEHRECHQT